MNIKYIVMVEYVNNLLIKLNSGYCEEMLIYKQMLFRLSERLDSIYKAIPATDVDYTRVFDKDYSLVTERKILEEADKLAQEARRLTPKEQRIKFPNAYHRIEWVKAVCSEVTSIKKGISKYKTYKTLNDFESFLLLYIVALGISERREIRQLGYGKAMQRIYNIFSVLYEKTYLGDTEENTAFATFFLALQSSLARKNEYPDINVRNMYDCFCFLYDNGYFTKGLI